MQYLQNVLQILINIFNVMFILILNIHIFILVQKSTPNIDAIYY